MEMANFEGLMKKSGSRRRHQRQAFSKMSDHPCKMSDEAQAAAVRDGRRASAVIQAVADGRSLEVSDADYWPMGRIYTGRPGERARLIDEWAISTTPSILRRTSPAWKTSRRSSSRKRFSFREIIESRWSSVFPQAELNTGVKLKYPDGVLGASKDNDQHGDAAIHL